MLFKRNPAYSDLVKTLCPFNQYGSSKILSGLVKAGNFTDAQNLFDEMPEKDIASWSIMVHGYARRGHHAKSTQLFSEMRCSGLVPNAFTMVGVLVSAAGLGNLLFTKCVHGLVVKHRQERDLIVGTALLNSYARSGSMPDSLRIFEGIDSPGMISCSAVIAGLVHNELHEDAVLSFNGFRKDGLVPGPATVLSLIKACVGLGSYLLCQLMHGFVEKTGLSLDLSVQLSVLDMYSGMLDINSATKIFSQMHSRDTISWSIMMCQLIHLERASEALGLFREMRNKKVGCDVVLIKVVISCCAMLGDLIRGRQVHAYAMVQGYVADVTLLNSLVAMYSKCGDLCSSRAIFDQVEEKTSVSWAAMISGYLRHNCPNVALNLFKKARQEKNVILDSVLLLGVIGASSDIASAELCWQLHCLALKAGLSEYKLIQNSLISAYSKSGNMELALNVFGEMGSCPQDIASWNAVLNGYAVNSCEVKAVSLYKEMRKLGIDLDGATYTTLLSACSRAGLVGEGLAIFNQLVEESRIQLCEEHQRCLIDLLARAGSLRDAAELAAKLLNNAGPSVWRALLSGCTLHQNVELGELAATRLSEMKDHEDPEPEDAVMLSNFYASLGRFEDSEACRSTLRKKGPAKSPAISWIKRMHHGCG
ncbi:hypothetical protein SAY86_002649 [Trapa natans]|uniref:Pentatricopeptide repeat-containing protein n=1 Tax=Trapa natans TaxID=22666 RepID=A0AAN7R2N7_TRANT|nr:hypothetical protein SAY86_002649 [Trapa natans]